MDKVFLEKYHQELKFFRDASKAFAQEHPKAAKRLGLSAPEIEDPYVERLIEAVSFLTARVNLKIDAEYPKFVQHILKVIHPDLTQAIPSAAIVELCAQNKQAFRVKKNTQIVTKDTSKGYATCQFSTCGEHTIVPFILSDTKYSHQIHDVVRVNQQQKKNKSLLSCTLSIPANFNLDHFDFSNIEWFISAHDLKVSSELLYFFAEKCEALQVELQDAVSWKMQLKPQFDFIGFKEFLSFYNYRSSHYLKYILEYAVLPEKYLFFKMNNFSEIIRDLLQKRVISLQENETARILAQPLNLQLTFTFTDTSEVLERYIDASSLSLNTVVINNIFKKRTRILVDQFSNEQHIVVDRLRPTDYEVIKIDRIEGYSKLNHQVKIFEPIYKLNNNTDHFDQFGYGFFSEFHQQSYNPNNKHSYKGSECYVLLTNQLKSIVEDDLDQLSVHAWCSNRALPNEISWSLDQDLKMADDSYKVTKIKRHSSFTPPIAAPMENTSLWRLLNLLSSRYVPLEYDQASALTEQIKNNLYLFFEITGNVSFRSQVNAIQRISAEKIRKIKRLENMLTSVVGLKFEIILDDMLMSHVHPYLWGRVLLEYIKSFSPINQFVELDLKNQNNTSIATYTTL